MESNKNKNLENTKYNAKLEKFYQEYKYKIINTEGEKTLQNFKERISKLNELEIKIARLEKFDHESGEILNNYKNYLTIAKEVD